MRRIYCEKCKGLVWRTIAQYIKGIDCPECDKKEKKQ